MKVPLCVRALSSSLSCTAVVVNPAEGEIQSGVKSIEEVVTDLWSSEDDHVDTTTLSKSTQMTARDQSAGQATPDPQPPNIINCVLTQKLSEDLPKLRLLPAVNKALLSTWSYFKFPRI